MKFILPTDIPVHGDQGDQWSQRQSTGHGRSLQGSTCSRFKTEVWIPILFSLALCSCGLLQAQYLKGGRLTGVSLSVGQKQTEALVARGRAGSLNGSRQIFWGNELDSFAEDTSPPGSRHWGLGSCSLVQSVSQPQRWPCQG